MNSAHPSEETALEPPQISSKNITRLKVIGTLLTLGGVSLFIYFIYIEGIGAIASDVQRFGLAGFAIILSIYFFRIVCRAMAWRLSVYEPYHLSIRDTIPAVVIGEAMSSMIPLGILISGTAKAVAVRKRLPLVVGLSSVATENLFYSIVTSVFLILGAFTFLRTFDLDEGWIVTLDVLIAAIALIVVLLVVMIVRQWHFLSGLMEWFYAHGIGRGIFEHGRLHARLFENLIYGYYRRYPRRFLPICAFEAAFHILGVIEGLFILSRITETGATLLSAFLLESVSRLITIVFKLVPFVIGVDEAGAQFVTETLGVGAAVGLTLAIIRKGRILFWTAVGILLIVKRGLTFREISTVYEPSRD